MQRMDDDHPVWDLVLSLGGFLGFVASLFWATLLLNPYVPVPVDRRIASLTCVIIAALMLCSAVGYWQIWKQRR